MRCEECAVVADDEARGWRAFAYGVGDEGYDLDDEELAVAAYCPSCAGREFDHAPPG